MKGRHPVVIKKYRLSPNFQNYLRWVTFLEKLHLLLVHPRKFLLQTFSCKFLNYLRMFFSCYTRLLTYECLNWASIENKQLVNTETAL